MRQILLRSITECTGWGAALGALYLPAGVYFFVGLSSRIDSGAWDTIDALDPWVTWLAITGFLIGGATGLVTGVVAALPISLAARGNASRRRLRLVGASTASLVVAMVTGAMLLWALGAPDDAPMWDLMIRPVWVVFLLVVPTLIAAVVVFWRTPRIVRQGTDAEILV